MTTSLDRPRRSPYSPVMTATEIMHEIDCLPPAEQAKVVTYTKRFDTSRQLSGSELGKLAQEMIESHDPEEVARLKSEIIRGFYGDE